MTRNATARLAGLLYLARTRAMGRAGEASWLENMAEFFLHNSDNRTFDCRVNQADSLAIEGDLRARVTGHNCRRLLVYAVTPDSRSRRGDQPVANSAPDTQPIPVFVAFDEHVSRPHHYTAARRVIRRSDGTAHDLNEAPCARSQAALVNQRARW